MLNRKDEKLVGVAVDKDKSSQYALKWAIDNIVTKGQSLTLIHVSNLASAWNNDGSNKEEVDQSREIFLPFRIYCSRRGIQCDDVIIHENEIAKALIDYVLLNTVDTLVLGSPSRTISRLFVKNDMPSVVSKGTPDFCNVYIISKGKVASGRKASRPLRHTSSAGDKSYETNPIPAIPRSENRMSVSAMEVHMPDPDITFLSSGRSSTDSSCFAFDDFPIANSQLSPPASKSVDSRTADPFLSESKSSDELFPPGQNQLNYASAQQIQEMEKKMKRLELELKQTMEMYHSACKVALKEKQKTKEVQLLRIKDEKKIEEAIKAKEEALESAQKEKALCKAAMDAARTAERIAQRETEKRIYAERKALKESVTKKIILATNLGRQKANDTIPKQKSLVHILLVVFIFFLYIISLIC